MLYFNQYNHAGKESVMRKVTGILLVLTFSSVAFAEIPSIPEPPPVGVAVIFNHSSNFAMKVNYSICAYEPTNEQTGNTDVCTKVYTKEIPKQKSAQPNYLIVFVPEDKLDSNGKTLISYKLKILEVTNDQASRNALDIISNPCSTDMPHEINAVSLDNRADKNGNHIIICQPTQFKVVENTAAKHQ